MNINTRNMAFVNFNEEDMQWLKVDGVIVYEAWKNLIASGVPPLTLLNSSGKDLVDYKLYGNSVQETRSGKNLINYPYFASLPTTQNGVTWSDNNGKLTATGTATGYSGFTLVSNLPVQANTNYRFYIVGTQTNVSVDITGDGLGVNIPSASLNNNGYTFNTGNATSITINIKRESNSLVSCDFYPMLVTGSYINDTEYEPYGVMPSPEFPSEIQSVGDLVTDNSDSNYGKYKIPVKVTGKNLLNIYDIFDFEDIVSVDNDGWLTITYDNSEGTSTKWFDFKTNINQLVKTSQNYKLIVEVKSVSGDGRIYFASNQEIAQVDTGASGQFSNMTTGIKTYNIKMKDDFTSCTNFLNSYGAFNAGTGGSITFRMSVLEDTTITADTFEYEPYQEPITTNIYLNEPLRKVGDYADYIDFENSKVIRKVGNKLLDGSYNTSVANWRPVEGYYAVGYPLSVIPNIYKGNSSGYIICNRLVSKDYSNLYNTSNPIEGISTAASPSYSVFIRIKSDTVDSKTEFLNYLNENPLDINYVLEEEESETIELPNIPTIKGTTILSIDTTIQPSNLEVVYKGK